MILVQIMAAVGEDQIGSHLPSQGLKFVFDGVAHKGEVAVAKRMHGDMRRTRAGKEGRGASQRLGFAQGRSAEDDPMDLETRMRGRQPQDAAAAADLNVVAVRSQAEHTLQNIP